MTIREYKGTTPQIAPSTYVDPMATVIGDVIVGEDSSIWPMASIRGDLLTITIGERTNIQDGCVLHTTHASKYYPQGFSLNIGSEVTVGHRAVLHGCTLEDNCLIGMGAIVLDGATVETNLILGAGSLVPPGKTLESGHLWVGTPAQKKRPLTPEEIEFLVYSPQSYVNLKNDYL